MKNLKFPLVVVIILFLTVSCVDAQFRRTVRGEGPVVKKERTTSSFEGVSVSSGIDVYLSQGNNERITVDADENLHEYIETEVRNGILHVYTDVNIRDAERKRVYVTIRNVRSLRTSSAGDIIGESPIKGDDISIGASSAGDIRIELTAKDVEVHISSSGNISLSGEAETLDASLSSAGDLSAFDFRVREAKVTASSAGDAQVYVTERLVARASSAGDITYQGKPKYVDAHASSAGGIRSR